MQYLTNEELKYVHEHYQENIELLAELGKIPAPSHQEGERAAFVKSWLESAGASGVYIDEALNVIYPVGCDDTCDVAVIMAHLDIVFPDTDPLPLYVQDGRMFAPGIGDDTANLVQLLMSARYVTQQRLSPKMGVVFVANSCEEGLGNLKGSRAIMERYGSRVKEFISFDGYMSGLVNNAVGSHRYDICIRTEGGHSYADFGNDNAIAYMAALIRTLYTKKVPQKAKTTYNVGSICGGTTVNSIAQECHMLYEFRSEDRQCLAEMESFFEAVIESFRHMGIEVEVTVKGIRPCKGDIDEAALEALTEVHRRMIGAITGENCQITAGSTDANIPLSMGIAANTFGTIRGGKAHTREEWVDLGSVEDGFKIALAAVLRYFR